MIENGPHIADIIRSRRAGRDQNVVDGVVATVANCLFTPEGGTENTDGQQQTIETASLYAPAGAPVPQPTDKIKIRGREGTYQCAGKADVWADLDGQPCGYQQRLERVSG